MVVNHENTLPDDSFCAAVTALIIKAPAPAMMGKEAINTTVSFQLRCHGMVTKIKTRSRSIERVNEVSEVLGSRRGWIEKRMTGITREEV